MEQLDVDKVYTDIKSGKNAERPQLKAMLTELREGDCVVVESIRIKKKTKHSAWLAWRYLQYSFSHPMFSLTKNCTLNLLSKKTYSIRWSDYLTS